MGNNTLYHMLKVDDFLKMGSKLEKWRRERTQTKPTASPEDGCCKAR